MTYWIEYSEFSKITKSLGIKQKTIKAIVPKFTEYQIVVYKFKERPVYY